jgi:ferric iron reductase protein FhuF
MTTTIHPVEETLARLAAVDEHFRLQLLPAPDDMPDWIPSNKLSDFGETHLNEILARVAEHYKSDSRQPAVSLWFGHHSFTVMAVAIAFYLTENRVPDLRPESVWARFEPSTGSGEALALAWRGRTFAALPDDPAAAHPDCIVLPTREALRDYLRSALIAHLIPLVEALRMRSSFGKPGLWSLASDSCASAFTWIAELIGDVSFGVAEARAFNATRSPLQRRRDFIHIEHLGLTYEMTDRTSCCLYYKVDGGEYCSTCPHRPMDERVERIKSWLEKEATEKVKA